MDGSWGAWSPPGKCSSSCGEGLQLSVRTCDRPAPKYGGGFCAGPSARTSVCQSPCPGNRHRFIQTLMFDECFMMKNMSSSLQLTGSGLAGPAGGSVLLPVSYKAELPSGLAAAPALTPPPHPTPRAQFALVTAGRQRTATTCLIALVHLSAPLPVSLPLSSNISICLCLSAPVNGGWGSWSPFSSCPVTCGVGLQVSNRKCDSPAPKHDGQRCHGEETRIRICKTNVHCPGTRTPASHWSGQPISCDASNHNNDVCHY